MSDECFTLSILQKPKFPSGTRFRRLTIKCVCLPVLSLSLPLHSRLVPDRLTFPVLCVTEEKGPKIPGCTLIVLLFFTVTPTTTTTNEPTPPTPQKKTKWKSRFGNSTTFTGFLLYLCHWACFLFCFPIPVVSIHFMHKKCIHEIHEIRSHHRFMISSCMQKLQS